MKCPRCGCTRLRYVIPRHTHWSKKSGKRDRPKTSRNDFTAECPQCKWSGEYKGLEE